MYDYSAVLDMRFGCKMSGKAEAKVLSTALVGGTAKRLAKPMVWLQKKG